MTDRVPTDHASSALLPPWPYPLWIAHRGAGKLAPENTLAAFRVGAAHGWRAFECDAKLSADGVPFLLHDATLERTTNGHGSAGEQPWSALARLDAGSWHSPAFAGERLPRLDAIASFCIDGGHALNIEIKPTPGQEAETGRVVAAAAQRLWAGQALPPLLSSFNVAALRAAAEAAPALPRALLLAEFADGWLAAAHALRCRAVVAHHPLLDAPRVAALHAAGLHALAYTVNDAASVQRLIGLGVVGIISDQVEAFAPPPGKG